MVLFSDIDVALLKDPFESMPNLHSLQGLSDDSGPDDAEDMQRRGNAKQCDVRVSQCSVRVSHSLFAMLTYENDAPFSLIP